MPFSGRELTFFDAFSKWLLYGCPKDILRSPFSVSRSFSVPRASPCAHTPDVIPRVSLPIARSLLVTPPISKPPKFSIPSPLLFSFVSFSFLRAFHVFSLPPQSSHAFLFSFFSLVHDWKRRQRYKGTEVKDVNFRLWKKLSISIPPPFYFSSPYTLPPTTHTPPLNPNKSPRLSLFSKWSYIVLPPSRQRKNKGETSFTTETLGLR